MIKKIVLWISSNTYLQLFLGLVVLATGLIDAWVTMDGHLFSGAPGAHHGVVLIGLWHVMKAVAEMIESFDYLRDGANG